MSQLLNKEDYTEPCCPLKMNTQVTPISVGRVIERLDAYLSRNDYAAAEKHLRYWLAEAQNGNDLQGELTVRNEQIGLYRKCGKEAECLEAIRAALQLAAAMGADSTVTYGTTLVNAATGYKAFGKPAEALPLYEQAKRIYESLLAPEDARLAGLYNNMALTLTELKEYRTAESLFFRAIAIMEQQPHGAGEVAVSYLNLADLVTAELGLLDGEAQADAYLQKAETLLLTEDLPRDGNYAFICEKCAPVFGYYGRFLTQQALAQRAREIYERA